MSVAVLHSRRTLDWTIDWTSLWTNVTSSLSRAGVDAVMGTNSLETLMSAIAGGSQSAFADFYDLTSSAAFGTALTIIRDRAQAEEVTQEAYVGLWRHADQWSSERGTPMTYLLTIVRRRAIDRIRSEEARKRRESTVDRYDVMPDEAEENVLRSEQIQMMRRHIGDLSDNQRQVIDLAFFEGQTQQQMSDDLGIPLGTVKTRMRDALSRLRSMGSE